MIRAYRQAFSGLPREVWLLSAMLLVNRSGAMVLPFLSLYLTQNMALSVAAAGKILAAYGLGSVLGAWLGGWLSDRIGPDATMRISLALSGVLYVVVGLQTHPFAVAVSVFVLGVFAESFRPAVMAAMGARAPVGLRMRAYALLRLAANLGVGIGPAVGGVLALVNYFWLFAVDGATCWAALAILIWGMPRETQTSAGSEPSTPARSGPWRDGTFLALMFVVTVVATVIFQVMSIFPVYLREAYGFREDKIGLLLAFNPLLIVLFEMVLTHWAELRRDLPLLPLGAALICVGFGLLPLGHSALFVASTIAVWTLGEMLAFPALNNIVAGRAVSANRGRYMGLYTMSFASAFIFAPALGGWTYARFGPDVLWYAIGGLALPLAAGFSWVQRRLRAEATAA